jgi:peptide/nickel transport system substrate-binding protein
MFKRKLVKIIPFLLVLVLLISTFASCNENGGKTTNPAAGKIDTLIVGTTMAIEKASRSEYYFDVLTGTISQMALVKVDETGAYQPLMAEYETNDSKTWTFTITDGLTWHDGTPVTAEDIKFTIEYLDLQNNGGYLSKYEDIVVLNDRQIRLVLKEANTRHLSNFTAMRIIPKHIYDGVADMATVAEELATIGCGPYKFVRFDKNAGVIEFAAYKDYVGGVPNVKNVIFKMYSNADTMNLALKAEEIDMVYYYAGGVDPTAAEDFASNGNITISTVKDASNTAVLVFNNNQSPCDDILIRKAIAAAIDYDKFRELFGSEYSTPSRTGFIPEGTAGFIETEVLTRNLDAARAYLAEAGAVDSNNDGTVEYHGEPLVIELLVRSDKPIYTRYAELLQLNLAEVGITITLKIVDVAEFRSISEKEHTNQMMVTKFTAYGMSSGAGMGSAYMSGRGTSNGQGQIMDEAYAEIVARLGSATTMEEYLAAAADCQEYYAENMPAVALYWDCYIQAYNSKLSGFVIDGTFGLLNMATWFSIEEQTN